MTTTVPAATAAAAITRRWHPALIIAATAAIAAGINLALWLAGSLAGAEFTYTADAATATASPVFVAAETVIPLALGLGLAAAFATRWRRTITIASVLGAAIAAATGIGPLVTDFDSATSSICLAMMHLVVAAAVVLGLRAVAASLN